MKSFRLDRTAFQIQTLEQATHQRRYWLSRPPAERLAAAWYLICAAYNLDPHQPEPLDRDCFSMRKQPV